MRIEVYHQPSGDSSELNEEDFLNLISQIKALRDADWYVVYRGQNFPISASGEMIGIPNNDFFKELIIRGLW
jgi:hypothetical protein